MATPLTRYLRDISSAHLAVLTDGQLLQLFTDQRDESAFAALVRRHGPLVLGACRRVLRDWHAAEDAFQATFLVLARRAGSLRRPEALGPWLYGVASRTALKARAKEARRQECEHRAGMALAVQEPESLVWRDLRPVLDDAVSRLPEKYRVAFVLHHLQGLAVSEVARRLGCPQGTAAARLARAKVRLRGRLARQGLAMSAAALATALSKGAASAAVPTTLSTATVEAAMRVAAGKAAGALSASAAVLTRGGLKTMSLSKVKVGLAVLLTVTSFGVGVGVSRHGRSGHSQAGADLAGKAGAREDGRRRPLRNAQALERFYAGGFRTTRGFESRDTAPKAGRGGVEGPDALNTEAKGIEVRAKESPTGSLLFGLGVNSDAGLVGSIVLNERNFDLFRQPNGAPDIIEGRAFRGAGQEFRIEAVPGTQFQRYTASFRDPFLFDRPYSSGANPYAGLVGSIVIQECNVSRIVTQEYNFDLSRPRQEGPKCQDRDETNDQPKQAARPGVRISLPSLGPVPVALDFGFPIVREEQEREQVFSFWVGLFS